MTVVTGSGGRRRESVTNDSEPCFYIQSEQVLGWEVQLYSFILITSHPLSHFHITHCYLLSLFNILWAQGWNTKDDSVIVQSWFICKLYFLLFPPLFQPYIPQMYTLCLSDILVLSDEHSPQLFRKSMMQYGSTSTTYVLVSTHNQPFALPLLNEREQEGNSTLSAHLIHWAKTPAALQLCTFPQTSHPPDPTTTIIKQF